MKEDAFGTAEIPDKFYFKIGEVSQIAGVAPYVLRFWEAEFKQINPKRTESGQRLYRQGDVALILKIKHLLYDRRFTIEGARQRLKKKSRTASKPPSVNAIPDVGEIKAELIRIRDLIDGH